MQVDVSLSSLEEWLDWAASNAFVYSATYGDEFAERVLAHGFIEPLTRKVVTPSDIDQSTRNWREGLVANGLNSRTRAVMRLIAERVAGVPRHELAIYGTEAITELALVLRGMFARYIGSEFTSDEKLRRGLFPIPFQDLTSLTWPDSVFDIVTTNEVLEHVPDVDVALRELARVLRPGGWHIGTHPFLFMSQVSDRRALLVDGRLHHLKEPEYHGNPMEPGAGSLVFELPGWDILDRARNAGFASAHIRFVASEAEGIVTENTGVFVFCAQK